MLLHEVYFEALGEGGGGDPDRRAGRGDRARLRIARQVARRVRRHGQGAGRRLGLGGADAARRATARWSTSGRPTTPTAWPAARRCWRSTCTSTPITSTSAPTPAAYVDAFMDNIAWERVAARFAGVPPARPSRTPSTRRPRARCSMPIPTCVVIDARLADDAHDGAGRAARRAARAARQGRRGRRVAARAAPRPWSIAPGASRSAATAPPSCANAASTPSPSPAASAPGAPTACRPNRSRKEKQHEMGYPRTSQDRPHRLPVADRALHREAAGVPLRAGRQGAGHRQGNRRDPLRHPRREVQPCRREVQLRRLHRRVQARRARASTSWPTSCAAPTPRGSI